MARTQSTWESYGDSYVAVPWAEGRNVLIRGTSKYINFGSLVGESGYGFRDNAGTMQVKNSGGSWANFGSGGSSAWGGITGTLSDQTDLQTALDSKQVTPVVVSGSLTAANETYYNNVASATYTDPSPVEGKGFIVFVRNGTATVGGTGYGTAGTLIYRIYHSGAWANYKINTPGGSDTYVQFNDAGSFNGVSSFVFDKTTGILTLASGGRLGVGGAPSEILHLIKPTGEFTTMQFDSGTTQGYMFAYDGDNSVNIGSKSNATVNIKVNNTTVGTFTPTLATMATDVAVPDEVYGAGWNGSVEVPTKNAVYDQMQLKLAITDIDDTPVNGETSAPISSNWAFDHAATVASDTVAGHVELAIASEVTTGTDATRAITPDALAGSEPGKRTIAILVSGSASGDTALATGDGLVAIPVDTTINGMNLVAVKAYVSTVSSSGAPLFQVRRSRRSSATARTIVDMLSTGVSIDASEFESSDAATAPTINTSNDDVQTGDILLIDCDTAGTGTKGAQILLTFQTP